MKRKDKMSKNIVLYHKNCLDGTCAAWVASQYLYKESTEYIAVEYGKTLTLQIGWIQHNNAKDKALYILDWCPEMDDLDACCKLFGKVILIDHHESAIKKLYQHYNKSNKPKNLEHFLAYHNEWTGAMGTAIWFNKDNDEFTPDFKEHWLVKAVDDRDRWQFKLPHTKMINEALFFHGFELSRWTDMDWNDNTRIEMTNVGSTLIVKKQQDCQAIIQSSAVLDDNKEKVIFCNCPYFLASEVGNILAKDYRMAVLWYMDKEGQISVSLRSNKDTLDWINCAKIAEQLGGGGHANAAGFKLNCSFEEMICALDDALIDTEQSIVPF